MVCDGKLDFPESSGPNGSQGIKNVQPTAINAHEATLGLGCRFLKIHENNNETAVVSLLRTGGIADAHEEACIVCIFKLLSMR
jgi:hypothetical protein